MILIPDEPGRVADAFTPQGEADILYIVSGYASVTALLWLLCGRDAARISPLPEFTMPPDSPEVRLLVGMAAGGCVSSEDHAAFQSLEQLSHGRVQIRYVPISAGRDVHTKLYVWTYSDGEAALAWSGSANFTMQGLGIGTGLQENILDEVDPAEALAYAMQSWSLGISCLEPGVDQQVPLDRSRFSRAVAPPTPTQPQEDDVVTTEDFYLYSRTRRRAYGPGAGVNWGTRAGRAQHDEAYLAIPARVGAADFFPEKNTPFRVVCDDGHVLTMRGASGSVRSGKDLSSWPSNAELGKYLRDRLGVPSGHVIEISDLVDYGRTYVTISRLRGGEYTLDFSPVSATTDTLAQAIVDSGA